VTKGGINLIFLQLIGFVSAVWFGAKIGIAKLHIQATAEK
jgi:hypothetical protein